MQHRIIDGEELARIALRNGFVADSRVVTLHRDQAEYLHGIRDRSHQGLAPEHPWGIDARTGCYSAPLLLDGFLRGANLSSAATGECAQANARLH